MSSVCLETEPGLTLPLAIVLGQETPSAGQSKLSFQMILHINKLDSNEWGPADKAQCRVKASL